ncbi:MAG: methylmalonyl-CoA mutase N-terminal domain/subunit [Myxococcota bacterium]|jgi:methylmalonyl-CoA mutase N-terminal domain/subunit
MSGGKQMTSDANESVEEGAPGAGATDRSAAIRSALERWRRETYAPEVEANGERKESFTTQAMKWPVKPLYTPADLDEIGFDYLLDNGFPGEYPYTRGTEADGYRANLWAMTQVTGFGTGEDSAKRWRAMLDRGLNGLIVEYDLPTTNGLDSDDPLADGEVCRAGTAIDSLPDMEAALDIPFEKVRHLTSVCNAPQPINLAMIIAALENKGVDPSTFTLLMPNAILIEYTCVGRYIYPPAAGLRISTDVIEYTIKHHPNWVPIAIVSAQLYAARATPVQELAFGFSIAMEYLDATLERGFDIDEVAPYFSFITGVDMDFFEAIAKLRAYRKIWARIMKERYNAKKPESMRLKLMGSPGTMSLTLQQPLNNIARLGIQMLACVLGGGGQQMTTPLHDEAHALPSDEASAVGAAIQNIVAHETGAADTIDPLAGSYYVETLTKRMEDEVFAEIEKIDALGGALKAIETGYFQKELAKQQYERQRDLETGERKLVGVNHLVAEDEKTGIEMFKHDESAQQRQIDNLDKVRANRDADAVAACLSRVEAAARGTDNLVPPILEAVKAHATHGEICNVLRDVFGTYYPDSLTAGV